MHLITEIPSVDKIILYGNIIYYRKSNVILRENSHFQALKDGFFGDFFIHQAELVLQDYTGIIHYKEMKIEGYFNYLNTKNFSFISKNDNLLYLYIDSTLFNTGLKLNTINADEYLLSFSNNEVLLYTLHGNQIWRYYLEQLGNFKSITNELRQYEVRKFVGIYNNTLILQLTNATILFLSLVDGACVKILYLNALLPLPEGVFYDDNIPPHIVNNHLIWLSNQRLLQVDLDTYEALVIRDFFNDSKESQFRFMQNTYFDEKIFFVADYGWEFVLPTRLGILDIKTGNVLWQQQLHNTGGLPEAPQITIDKVYIRSARGTLYIYENQFHPA